MSQESGERKFVAVLGFAMEIEPAFVAVALERLSEMGLEPRLC